MQIIASYAQIRKHFLLIIGWDVCEPLVHLQLQLLLLCDGDKDVLNIRVHASISFTKDGMKDENDVFKYQLLKSVFKKMLPYR